MSTDNTTVAGILLVLFLLTTQVIKNTKPEKFEKYSKYITFGLMALGAVLSVVYFFAFNTPVVAENDWQMVWIVFNQLVLGVVAGAGASGFYEAANRNSILAKQFKSVYTILSEREPKEGNKVVVRKPRTKKTV